MWVRSLGQEVTLEEEMATYTSILAWVIPWTQELGELQSMGSQRVGQTEVTQHSTSAICCRIIFHNTHVVEQVMSFFSLTMDSNLTFPFNKAPYNERLSES